MSPCNNALAVVVVVVGGGVPACSLDSAVAVTTVAAAAPTAEGATRWFRPNTDDIFPSALPSFFGRSG